MYGLPSLFMYVKAANRVLCHIAQTCFKCNLRANIQYQASSMLACSRMAHLYANQDHGINESRVFKRDH